MKRRNLTLLLLGSTAAVLSNCGGGGGSGGRQKFQYVDQIIVEKNRRRLRLMKNNELVKEYRIGLGFNPLGHKMMENDGRTPEGLYYITHHNPRSSFHLSLGISYPNAEDHARAEALGVNPGGDIFIHGESRNPAQMTKDDWTAGCIAVKNFEIEQIYNMVDAGTPIDIRA